MADVSLPSGADAPSARPNSTPRFSATPWNLESRQGGLPASWQQRPSVRPFFLHSCFSIFTDGNWPRMLPTERARGNVDDTCFGRKIDLVSRDRLGIHVSGQRSQDISD